MILVSGCQHRVSVLGEGRPKVWLPARLPYLHPDTTNEGAS